MKHSQFYLLPKEEEHFPRGEMFRRPIYNWVQITKFLAWKLFSAEGRTLCFGVHLQAQQDRSPGTPSTASTNNRAVGQEIYWWAPEEATVCIRKPENLEVMREGREKNHSVLETGRQAEKREWDCKDRQVGRKRERCNSAPAPAWFVPPPLSWTRTTHSSSFFYQKA